MTEEIKKIVPLPVLNGLFRAAISQLKQQGIITWSTEFMVTAVDCNGRPKGEWNVHLYCDDTSKANKAQWATQFKTLVTGQVLEALSWTNFWVVLDGVKPSMSPFDLNLPADKFLEQMRAAGSDTAPKHADDINFRSADEITDELIQKYMPKGCRIGTRRCEPCSCEDK